METFRCSFKRALTINDRKQHIPFDIQVPPGTTHLQIRFCFEPHKVNQVRNLLTLTVFDPSGWRGEGHRGGNRQEVILAADQATPGYLARPVHAGLWKVVVNTHMIMPGPACQFHLEVSGTDEPIQGSQPIWEPGRTTRRGAGWYRGDLHAHSHHSDANWDVSGLTAYARAQRLDFATLSDHNTISGLIEMGAASADDLLTLVGMELTTFWGHALILGRRDWIDWRVFPGKRTMEDIEKEATQSGNLFIVAHPMADGDPKCTGCNWRYPQTMPGAARLVEVWNTNWLSDSNNEECLKLVYTWLNLGYRIAMTAGTDNHGHSDQREYGFNVVYADDLSETEILQAVRAGHLYLSSGPALILEGSAGDAQARMGEVLKPGPNDLIQLTARWDACPIDAQLELVLDGEVKEHFVAQPSGVQTWKIQNDQTHWGLVALRDPQGKMLALTNPIYWDGRD